MEIVERYLKFPFQSIRKSLIFFYWNIFIQKKKKSFMLL